MQCSKKAERGVSKSLTAPSHEQAPPPPSLSMETAQYMSRLKQVTRQTPVYTTAKNSPQGPGPRHVSTPTSTQVIHQSQSTQKERHMSFTDSQINSHTCIYRVVQHSGPNKQSTHQPTTTATTPTSLSMQQVVYTFSIGIQHTGIFATRCFQIAHSPPEPSTDPQYNQIFSQIRENIIIATSVPNVSDF